MYNNLSSADFSQMLKEAGDNAVLLDVRTDREYDSGFIPGSTLVNLMHPGFADSMAELDPEKEVFVYCRSGNRSGMVCGYLAGKGFGKVHNLAMGLLDWSEPLATLAR